MASTFSTIMRFEKQAYNENDTTWGTKLNVVIDLVEASVAGMATVATTGGSTTLSTNNSAADEARCAIIKATGALVSAATFVIPAQTKKYTVWNATSGAYTLTIKTSGGTGVTIDQGKIADVFCDATDMYVSATNLLYASAPEALGAAAAIGASVQAAPGNHVHQRQLETICIAIGDETTAITTGTAKVTFRMPYAFTLVGLPRASLTTASSSGLPTFDINETGATVLSTKITIDANETTSTTAVTPCVVSDTALADDASITIDVDVAGTGAAGAKIYLIGRQA